MKSFWSRLSPLLLAGLIATCAHAVTVKHEAIQTVITGERYRLGFVRESADLLIEVRGADGQWHIVSKPAGISYSVARGDQSYVANGARATWTLTTNAGSVIVGQQIALDRNTGTILDLSYICRDEGLLLGTRLIRKSAEPADGVLWSPPRLTLSFGAWDSYLFWGEDHKAHAARLDTFQRMPAYAGISAWGGQGDVVRAFDAARPALIVQSSQWGSAFGIVFLDYANRWKGVPSFLQRYSAKDVYLYSSLLPAGRASERIWAWLAPFNGDQAAIARQVETLVHDGEALSRNFHSVSQPIPDAWVQPAPDISKAIRRTSPVVDINDAAVFTMNEPTTSNYALDLARRSGSDMLIRGWFKWNQAPQVQSWRDIPQRAHEFGALFGGGITCSALYDHENGLTRTQVLDMATRGPDGELVDAWGQPGIRHGSLSCPAYLDYLFRWCREQVDAGADYLFMDEHNAALGQREGYDDYSLKDFRAYLLEEWEQTRGWKRDAPGWASKFKVALTNAAICPDGSMSSFDYRAYLRINGHMANPLAANNPLASSWHSFRKWRDDRAWKVLTDRIRAHTRQQNRRVLISANGLVPYVDLQVLGVWDNWLVKDGQIDLAQNQIPYWRGLVMRGHDLAGRRVPVVLFHDWGMGETPFPWMAVPPSQREIWLRTRAPEIYAAGGFFAFPVLGPFGCDAGRDGTMDTMVRQSAFYQAHRDLYLRGRFLGAESIRCEATNVSVAVWSNDGGREVVLHVINREVKQGRLEKRQRLVLQVPIKGLPAQAQAFSPDWEGSRPVTCNARAGMTEVQLPELEAYAVAVLRYAEPVDVSACQDPMRVRLAPVWDRPARNLFRVRADGSIEHSADLNGMLQGQLHADMRNPPAFVVNAASAGSLAVHLRAVSTAGARLECRIDDRPEPAIDIPDLDHKNDSNAAEYDRVITFPIPAGTHRIILENSGPDWLVLNWIEFRGAFKE